MISFVVIGMLLMEFCYRIFLLCSLPIWYCAKLLLTESMVDSNFAWYQIINSANSPCHYYVLGFLPDQVIAGELASFVSYAQAFPNGFLALIDTYDAVK